MSGASRLAPVPGQADTNAANNRLAAVAWMMGSLVSFSSIAIAGRELTGDVPMLQVMAVRSMIGLAIMAAVVAWLGWDRIRLPRPMVDMGWLLARNAVHFYAQFAWFVALGLLPLAEVFAIEFSQPLWVALIAVAFLGERVTRYRSFAIALGFVGVLIILRPGLEIINPAALLVLSAAVGFAMSVTLTKMHLNTGRIAPMAVVFYMMLLQLPVGLVLAYPTWVSPSFADWIWLVVVGIGGLTAHLCLAKALSLGDASFVIPMDFLRLPLIAFLAWLLYSEALSPWVAIGAAVVCLGNWLSVRRG